eukprot:SAG31_NODE_311_length_17866_cov_7.010750_14_plen_72_part_00
MDYISFLKKQQQQKKKNNSTAQHTLPRIRRKGQKPKVAKRQAAPGGVCSAPLPRGYNSVIRIIRTQVPKFS